MVNGATRIQVFEHQTIYYGTKYDDVLFKKAHFNALAKLNQLHDNKYFTLVNKGVKFSQYVGVIQVDSLCIEILPKIDRAESNKDLWQRVLIDMLRVTKKLKVNNVDHANVNKQNIHLLDIYFDWFLREVQLLIRQGLIKKYHKETSNVKSLKGKLEFAQHINRNLIHKERFYTTHQVYDKNHEIHQILGLALDIVAQSSRGSYLYSKCKSVQLDFPEVSTMAVTGSTFEKLVLTRKTKPYQTALEIARFIILNFSPNISSGSEKMLALLFDMNSLWEEYVLVRLKQAVQDSMRIFGQQSKGFWYNTSLKPDIVIVHENQTFVIDTKWKMDVGNKPGTHDLRQMYLYNEYWKSNKSLLLYPSIETQNPNFVAFKGDAKHTCAIGRLNIFDGTKLNDNIGNEILSWFYKDELKSNMPF